MQPIKATIPCQGLQGSTRQIQQSWGLSSGGGSHFASRPELLGSWWKGSQDASHQFSARQGQAAGGGEATDIAYGQSTARGEELGIWREKQYLSSLSYNCWLHKTPETETWTPFTTGGSSQECPHFCCIKWWLQRVKGEKDAIGGLLSFYTTASKE